MVIGNDYRNVEHEYFEFSKAIFETNFLAVAMARNVNSTGICTVRDLLHKMDQDGPENWKIGTCTFYLQENI